MIDRDKGSWEKALKEAGGSLYDTSDLEGVIRNISNTSQNPDRNRDPKALLDEAIANYGRRNTPTASAGGSGGDADVNGDGRIDLGWSQNAGGQFGRSGPAPRDPIRAATTAPAGHGFSGMASPVGNQFNDPYTVQLEDRIKAQLAQLQSPIQDPARDQLTSTLQQAFTSAQQGNPQYRQMLETELARLQQPVQDTGRDQYQAALQGAIGANNPQLDKLLAFIDQQFTENSQTPGYSQDERAILNTQAFEPIEALRNASKQREMERTSAAGYLPTSGTHNARMSGADRYYDQMRTVTNRDLAAQMIDRRDADLSRALELGQMGVALPQAQQDRTLSLNNMLAQLTGQARLEDEGRKGQALQVGTTLHEDLPQRYQSRAIDLSSLMNTLSQAGRQEEQGRQDRSMNLSTQLYQLPALAQAQAMAAMQGSDPAAAINSWMQMYQQQQYQQQVNDQRNAALYGQIGEILAGLFD